MMTRLITCLFLLSVCEASAAETATRPVHERFAAEKGETPDFQRHVVPLLGRLGCNGRECHGSFQGQGGFRLSLFGYDFAADHAALMAADEGRVDPKNPTASLILRKPTLAEDHDGGERFKKDSWEYRLLQRWIEAGAPGAKADGPEFASLEVEPREIAFTKAGESVPLRAFARWSDGTREEVTSLCRFRTNDESIAKIDAAGIATAVAPGDTHVVVFYDNGITPVSVLLPVSESAGRRYPAVPTPTRIDKLVVQKLRPLGIVPSELCDDATFLRRVSLDLTATLPLPAEVEAFLADQSPQKRAKKVDELLQRPTYAAWWATRLGDWMGNHEQNLPIGGEQGVRREKSAQWHDWLARRFEQNMPYDKIVAGIVLGTSRQPNQSADDFYAEMASYFRKEKPADFAARESIPYFWTRGRFTPPQPLRFSYAFLGIRLECAQCHKHPYDQWTKDDYEGFEAFFSGVGTTYSDRRLADEMKKSLGLTADQDSAGYKKLFADLAAAGTRAPWQEVAPASLAKQVAKARRAAQKGGGRVFTPKLLGGDEVDATTVEDSRAPLMSWLRQKDNPYFARAIVNRIWAGYFGVGIVEPPDDMNLANPPSNGPLLDYLADEFVARGYDLKWLHREIATSRTYQLSWRPNATNERDERNFSRAIVRRLPAEAAYDAIVCATADDESRKLLRDDPATVRTRAIGASSGHDRRDGSYATNLFGKPARAGICDCERSNEPSLLQTIYLRNDAELHGLLQRKTGWLALALAAKGNPAEDELIRQAYLRTFSRPPTAEETTNAREHFAKSADRRGALRDLMWALVNSKEFMLNH